MKFHYLLLNVVPFLLLSFSSIAQKETPAFLPGDALPDAPELAARGDYKVGVRTLKFVNKDQIDILNSKDGSDPLYDRPLTVEVWYPAQLSEGEEELVTYEEVMGTANNPMRPVLPFTFQGRAAREAKPLVNDTPYPFVIVSHGYVGSRFLMTYLTENLASKGYIVVAIDHTESTFRDAAPFPSTLLNRSKDVLFILDQMASSKHFLSSMIDVNNTAIIGYSMGGYGVLNVAGAGYSDKAVQLFGGMTQGSSALAVRGISNENYRSGIDSRIKAVVAFAPWGMKHNVWDAESLKSLKIPTFFVAGSEDDVSGYEDGIKAIYEGSVNVDRYLLTYKNARHNVAPNPPPAATLKPGLHFDEYYRYAEPSWNEKRINNINQHFVTAFLGIHLKQMDYSKYLDVQADSNEKNWTGFKPRSSTGLELLHSKKAAE
ncbi:MAG: dienelactone hydrolase family protein [Bacteroidota bacterium]